VLTAASMMRTAPHTWHSSVNGTNTQRRHSADSCINDENNTSHLAQFCHRHKHTETAQCWQLHQWWEQLSRGYANHGHRSI